MAFLDPFAVDGATITAAQLRRHLYQTVKGMTGVLGPESLKVMAVPGSPGVVGIMPGLGAVSVASRREAYQVDNTAMDGDALLTIPAAGSGGATWHIIVEVDDPQYHGSEPAARPRAVGSLAGLTRPYIHLASFTLPAGGAVGPTTTITDRRRIAAPLSDRWMATVFPTGSHAAGTSHPIPTGGYASWPIRGGERPSFYVPEWATHLSVTGHFSGILYVHSGSADTAAGIRTGFGTEGAENGIILATAANGNQRIHATVVGRHAVPAERRGTVQAVNLQGVRSQGQGMFYADYQSAIVIDVQFTEEPA